MTTWTKNKSNICRTWRLKVISSTTRLHRGIRCIFLWKEARNSFLLLLLPFVWLIKNKKFSLLILEHNFRKRWKKKYAQKSFFDIIQIITITAEYVFLFDISFKFNNPQDHIVYTRIKLQHSYTTYHTYASMYEYIPHKSNFIFEFYFLSLGKKLFSRC